MTPTIPTGKRCDVFGIVFVSQIVEHRHLWDIRVSGEIKFRGEKEIGFELSELPAGHPMKPGVPKQWMSGLWRNHIWIDVFTKDKSRII